LLTVVGLGNPGIAYKNSRHNTGFMLLDGIVEGRFIKDVSFRQSGRRFVRRLLGSIERFDRTSGPFVSIEGELNGNVFLLIKPTTFMNDSGRVFSYCTGHGIINDLSEILVIVDDIDIEIGHIRLRTRGSSGGHKGLQSIINHLGSVEFARLRVGIGPRPQDIDLTDYVLDTFCTEEQELLEKSLSDASTIVEAWIRGGLENAQRMMSHL